MDLSFQGEALPDVTKVTEKQATAPQFYTDYLQNITNMGQNAIQEGGVAGLGGLTQTAMNMAPSVAFAGANTIGTGADMVTQAGQTSAPDIIQNYMSPFTSNVVDEMGRLTNRGINENVLPGLEAGAIGSGNFGSRRGAVATGQTLRDVQSDLLGRQYGALNTGYQNAMTSAQNDLTRQVNAGNALGTLGLDQQTIGQGGLKTLTSLGDKQQTQKQSELDKPMLDAQNYAKLLQSYGAYVPTGSVSSETGPGTQGQYGMSGLQQIATIASLMNAITKGDYSNLGSIINQPAKTS